LQYLIVKLAAATNMRTLYPANHPRVRESVANIVSALKQVLEERETDSVTFLVVGDDLVIDDEALRRASLPQVQFVQSLKQRGIERLTLADGLPEEEVFPFIDALALGHTPRSSPHIVLGRVRVSLDEEPSLDAPDSERQELSVEQLERVREAFGRFRSERKLPISQIEELVWSFIDSLSRTTRAILPLAKLKEHDEYTFVHSVNVSLLVLAQARTFGIQGAMLHSFGMAGLLHDVGKLMIPLAVLNKSGTLEAGEWEEMKTHAEQGAWLLSEIEGTAPLPILVAFEHHLRYDLKPNYPQIRTPRMPNLASRMTAVADSYDAMSTVRPYQQPLLRAAAIEILTKRSGTFHDPLLVGNFIRLIGQDAAAQSSS
jgi:HD-GYP domain-containing protein (c-di-GMP phosphodiesterase class II)